MKLDKEERSRIEEALRKSMPVHGADEEAAEPDAPETDVPEADMPEADMPEADALDANTREMAAALMRLAREGKLPPAFDLQAAAADPALHRLLDTLPPYAAVRVYIAERQAGESENTARARLTEEFARRSALPRSQRSGTGASAGPDYAAMDSAEFIKLKNAIQTAARSGKRIPL